MDNGKKLRDSLARPGRSLLIMAIGLLGLAVSASGCCGTAGAYTQGGDDVLLRYTGSDDGRAAALLAEGLRRTPDTTDVRVVDKKIGLKFEGYKYLLIPDTSPDEEMADVVLVCQLWGLEDGYDRVSRAVQEMVTKINEATWIVASVDSSNALWLCASYAYDNVIYREPFVRFLRRAKSKILYLIRKYGDVVR